DGRIAAAGRQGAAVGGKGQRPNDVLRAEEALNLLVRNDLPEVNAVLVGPLAVGQGLLLDLSNRQHAAAGRKPQGVATPGKAAELLPGRRIPDTDGVAARRSQQLPARREDQGV